MTLKISPRVQIVSDIKALFQEKGLKFKHCDVDFYPDRVSQTVGVSYCGRRFHLHFNPTAIEEIYEENH